MSGPFKILSVFGTRPEAIKMAPVLMKLGDLEKKSRGRFVSRTLVTAQHRQMLDTVLGIFNIRPDHDLDIMSENQSLDGLSAKIITRISDFLDVEKPDLMLVHGDTTTTMAASLAAFYKKIPVGHVEAGLRTSNIYSPFPEEINRRMCDVISSYHFAPTETARGNLLRENIADRSIYVTGNTVVDALLYILKNRALPIKSPAINKAIDAKMRIILVTAHRRENFGEAFERMCDAFYKIVREHEDVAIVYPVHLNPNVRNIVNKKVSTYTGSARERIILEPPMEYLEFVTLMNLCYLILTDSGGIQEEGATLSKPVLVMRDTTERPELIEAGCGMLVGSDIDMIANNVGRLLSSRADYEKMAHGSKCFGDGTAAEKIAGVIEKLT